MMESGLLHIDAHACLTLCSQVDLWLLDQHWLCSLTCISGIVWKTMLRMMIWRAWVLSLLLIILYDMLNRIQRLLSLVIHLTLSIFWAEFLLSKWRLLGWACLVYNLISRLLVVNIDAITFHSWVFISLKVLTHALREEKCICSIYILIVD